ncbi:flavin reductase family protein [Amycolatopsis pithecellobii]|uniref:Flavin reductase family protein n=1 Tax=Amycolatopsis pithecellobii TaxID=664692 RepID=A0A6N7YPC5_9PSEU|nr:flavin reductase family protein [Amycolatopsis pithecellobii]MTD54855.1 flavin reductase family protein [Amycolatopsis pithecellobii]
MSRALFDCADPEVNPYALMTSLIVPRPIAWISTMSKDGVGNLAPHSFFSVACASPPIICFTSVGRKDTLANILATGQFVVNVATEPMLHLVNNSAAAFGAGVDEAEVLGIEMEPSASVEVPRVAASPASLECVFHSMQDLGDSVHVLGTVLRICVDEDAIEHGLPQIDRLRPLSRLGANEWGLTPPVTAVDRPMHPRDIAHQP